MTDTDYVHYDPTPDTPFLRSECTGQCVGIKGDGRFGYCTISEIEAYEAIRKHLFGDFLRYAGGHGHSHGGHGHSHGGHGHSHGGHGHSPAAHLGHSHSAAAAATAQAKSTSASGLTKRDGEEENSSDEENNKRESTPKRTGVLKKLSRSSGFNRESITAVTSSSSTSTSTNNNNNKPLRPIINSSVVVPSTSAGRVSRTVIEEETRSINRRASERLAASSRSSRSSVVSSAFDNVTSRPPTATLIQEAKSIGPRRTDYTYGVSYSYKAKPPTPEWQNPKLSRQSLRGKKTQFIVSKLSASWMSRFWDTIFGSAASSGSAMTQTKKFKSKRVANGGFRSQENVMGVSDDDEYELLVENRASAASKVQQEEERGHSRSPTEYAEKESTISIISTSVDIVTFLITTLLYVLIWPLYVVNRLRKNVLEYVRTNKKRSYESSAALGSSSHQQNTYEDVNIDQNIEESVKKISVSSFLTKKSNSEKTGEKENRVWRTVKGACCCCPWPLIICLLLTSLLAAALFKGGNSEAGRDLIRTYIVPFPFLLANRTRQAVNSTQTFVNAQYNSLPDIQLPAFPEIKAPSISLPSFSSFSSSPSPPPPPSTGCTSTCSPQKQEVVYKYLDPPEAEVKAADLVNLRASIDSFESQLGIISSKCCSQPPDLSPYATHDDITTIRASLDSLSTAISAESVKVEERIAGIIASIPAQLPAPSPPPPSPSASASVEDKEELIRHQEATILAATVKLKQETQAEVSGLLDSINVQKTELNSLILKIEALEKAERVRKESPPPTPVTTEKVIIKETSSGNEGLSGEDVNSLIAAAIHKYDLDKTGLPDFALESSGGSVISIRCSESYSAMTRKESVLGIPLWYTTYSPRVAIQPGVVPGECWAFKGSKGFLVVKLNGWIDIDGVSIEHISPSVSPDGHIESAPKDFEIWGLDSETEYDGKKLGKFRYDAAGTPLQYFPIKVRRKDEGFPLVELRIGSNQGHPVYTCLYRLRVHGKRLKPAYGNDN